VWLYFQRDAVEIGAYCIQIAQDVGERVVDFVSQSGDELP
jgi:hypothetical protein